jgi:hypothetical protein
MVIVDPELRARLLCRATERYESEDLEIDGDPAIVPLEYGAWLQAWVWAAFEDGESATPVERVPCALCGEPARADEAHRHGEGWIGECCWDERLRTTE